jgi:hypothetical protein
MNTALDLVFENQPKLLSTDQAAVLVSLSRDTFYDMNYRPAKYGVPLGMFVKNGRKLLVVTDKLRDWFISRTEVNHEL